MRNVKRPYKELVFLEDPQSNWVSKTLLNGGVRKAHSSTPKPSEHRHVFPYLSLSRWATPEQQNKISLFRPAVIIHMADEKLRHSPRNYGKAHTVIREYFNPMLWRRRVYFVPIGYNENLVDAIKALPPVSEKTFLWSFVGNLKNDRGEMLEAFKSLNPHKAMVNQSGFMKGPMAEDIDVAKAYRASNFVLCPFGSLSPDTWRIMEALEAGAIPVTVALRGIDYFKFTFGDHPFIIGKTWKDAAAKVRALSENPERLELLQQEAEVWYANYLDTLKKDVELILGSSPANNLQSSQFRYQRRGKWSPQVLVKFWLHFKIPPAKKRVLQLVDRVSR
jgi:glycosyltransferase involved in cell wall biosynthesis